MPGEVRAFYNACAHRAHPLVEGQGRKQRPVCPYHAWTYDPDGRLRHARGTQSMAHFERNAICLSEVRTEWLLDFVFINLDDGAPPLASQAPGLADDIRTHLPMYDALVARGERSFVPPETRANWKVVVDDFARVLPLSDGASNVLGTLRRHILNHGRCRCDPRPSCQALSPSRSGEPRQGFHRLSPAGQGHFRLARAS